MLGQLQVPEFPTKTTTLASESMVSSATSWPHPPRGANSCSTFGLQLKRCLLELRRKGISQLSRAPTARGTHTWGARVARDFPHAAPPLWGLAGGANVVTVMSLFSPMPGTSYVLNEYLLME